MRQGKRCVIIGSGLGGLSTAVILARNGYDVTVLEQGHRIGGCLQCFTRKGAKFETGMHFIGSALPGQTLNKLMRYLGIGDLPLCQLDPMSYDIVHLSNGAFRFANGREPFIETMAGYFPREKDNIVRYYDLVQKIAQASSLHSLRYAESDHVVNTEYQTVSINTVLDSLFNDELIKNVIVGNLPLYAAEKDKTPFSQHAFIMDFYNQSAFRVVGGSDSIATGLQHEIERLGGKIFTRSKVTKIVCDNEKATGVVINEERMIPADIVIAAIHPSIVMELVDSKMLRPVFRNRMASLRNTISGFSVYLRFKPGLMPYLNSNFYCFNSNSPWGCEHYTTQDWPKGYLYMHFCDYEEPRFASSGVILSYMHMKDVERWAGTSIGHRGEDYEVFKRSRAEKLMSEVEKTFPGFLNAVECYYTSTPLTYQDYTGTQNGSMYGVAKDINLGPAGRVPHRTRIPNLLLTGQNVNSHGMLGVLVGSIVTCSDILTSEKIYKQILEANR